jgi:hypothetical protein
VHPVTLQDPFQRTSQPPATVAIIPVRYASTRLPGKALADIGGRPMIEHVYRRTAAARSVDAGSSPPTMSASRRPWNGSAASCE